MKISEHISKENFGKKEYDELVIFLQEKIKNEDFLIVNDLPYDNKLIPDPFGIIADESNKVIFNILPRFTYVNENERTNFQLKYNLLRQPLNSLGDKVKSIYMLRYAPPGIFIYVEIFYSLLAERQTIVDYQNCNFRIGDCSVPLLKSIINSAVFRYTANLEHGCLIEMKELRCHPIDTSAELLYFSVAKVLNRAMWNYKENYPMINDGELIERFRPRFYLDRKFIEC